MTHTHTQKSSLPRVVVVSAAAWRSASSAPHNLWRRSRPPPAAHPVQPLHGSPDDARNSTNIHSPRCRAGIYFYHHDSSLRFFFYRSAHIVHRWFCRRVDPKRVKIFLDQEHDTTHYLLYFLSIKDSLARKIWFYQSLAREDTNHTLSKKTKYTGPQLLFQRVGNPMFATDL